MQPRTKRQKEILDFIANFIENDGHEPTYQQIAQHLNLKSKGGIAKHIKSLENQGLLNRRRGAGGFNLEVPNHNSAADSVTKIEWLDAPTDTGFKESWEENPLFVPNFLLGYLDPLRIRAFRVPDDSMTGKNIAEGDIALIEQRQFVRDGDCIAATIENTRTVVQIFFRAGANIELHPANVRYEIIRLSADQIKIQGVFRGLIRPLI